jgi:hypothetical protein
MDRHEEIKVAVMQEQIGYIKTQVDTILLKLDTHYTSKEEHDQLEKRVSIIEANLNKIVWIILTAIILAALALILK